MRACRVAWSGTGVALPGSSGAGTDLLCDWLCLPQAQLPAGARDKTPLTLFSTCNHISLQTTPTNGVHVPIYLPGV